MARILYTVLDGLGDRPVPALGGRTPLEAAAVPFLGAMALDGRTGLVQTVGAGIAPESDVAVTARLGYDPFTYHTGRGGPADRGPPRRTRSYIGGRAHAGGGRHPRGAPRDRAGRARGPSQRGL